MIKAHVVFIILFGSFKNSSSDDLWNLVNLSTKFNLQLKYRKLERIIIKLYWQHVSLAFNIYIYIYILIERDREREQRRKREIEEKKRERERERGREREREISKYELRSTYVLYTNILLKNSYYRRFEHIQKESMIFKCRIG